MDRLFANPAFRDVWAKAGATTVADAVSKFFPEQERRRKVTVRSITLSGNQPIDAFIKLYHHRDGGWRFWLRKSKAKCEFDNYLTFQRLGVPSAEVIACGEERDGLGRLHRDFIVTRAVPQARGLDDFFRARPEWRRRGALLLELAAIVRRLHAADFFYHDLVWRNLLVSDVNGEAKLFLIDCPRGGVARFGRRRRLLRDLASLDKSASQLCSRAERLRFLLLYLGKKRVDDEARALARACIEYRRRRWPEDWRGK
jgi:tRNA A-37 threonylcarbamoyl transferase component Bud32